jgi:hypothetical protein
VKPQLNAILTPRSFGKVNDAAETITVYDITWTG